MRGRASGYPVPQPFLFVYRVHSAVRWRRWRVAGNGLHMLGRDRWGTETTRRARVVGVVRLGRRHPRGPVR